MEVKIVSLENKEVGKQKLPDQFSEAVRPDLIKRAVIAIEANERQQYGADPLAGKRYAADLSRRRRKYKGAYGKGISRVPRKTMSRRGSQMNWVGAFAPGTVGGRRAFPPSSSHIFAQDINDKERKKAICSALAATMQKDVVAARGHKVPEAFPFIVVDDFEKLKKTSDVVSALKKFGFEAELERADERKVRAGKGTMRGRRYKRPVGPLFVVSGKCDAAKAAKNVPGCDIIDIAQVNAKLLAPGTVPGRLTIFTKSAIEKMAKEKLFR